MKPTILLLALTAAALSSCTTAYKTGQTPDDVYYSPAKPQDEYVRTQKEDDRQYRSDEEYYDDRYLRMKVHNRILWSDLDDWYYFGNRYNYSSYHNWNNPWSPNTYWNYYYNPYCNSYSVTVNPKSSVVYNRPRTFNLNTYYSNLLTNGNYTNPKGSPNNTYTGPGKTTSSNNNSNNNSNSNTGNILRNIFNSSNNNNSSSTHTNSNNSSSSSSSNNSNSSSGSSGSSAPVRRF